MSYIVPLASVISSLVGATASVASTSIKATTDLTVGMGSAIINPLAA